MTNKKKKNPANQFYNLFGKIHTNHQQLLQLLAIIYEPVSVTKLYKCINQLDIKDSNDKKYTQKKLKQTLEELQTRGILESFNKNFFVTSPLPEKLCRLALAEGIFHNMADTARKEFPLRQGWDYTYFTSAKQCFSDIRMAIYNNDTEKADNLINHYAEVYQYEYQQQDPAYTICFQPFDAEWFSRFSPDMMSLAIQSAFRENSCNFAVVDELMPWLLNSFQSKTIIQAEQLAFMCAGQFLLHGDLASANTICLFTDDYHRLLLSGWQQFIQGENDLAIESFETAIAMYKKMTRKRKVFINNLSGVFFILALIKSKDPQRLQQALDYSKLHRKQKQHSNPASHQVLAHLHTTR